MDRSSEYSKRVEALRPVFGGLKTAPEQGSTGHDTFKPANPLA